jgi:hypothetical protein
MYIIDHLLILSSKIFGTNPVPVPVPELYLYGAELASCSYSILVEEIAFYRKSAEGKYR